MRRPVARHDALDAGVLRCREERALRVEKVRGQRGYHDVRACKESDKLVVRGLCQVRMHEHLGAALLEIDHDGLARGAHDHGDAL